MYRKDWIGKWAEYFPEKIAISEFESGRKVTYARLNDWAVAVAAKLTIDYGLQKGDRLAIIAENHLEQFVLFSAAQKSGLILAPLNYRLAPPEIAFMLKDARPSILFIENKYRTKYQGLLGNPSFKVIPLSEIAEWEQSADSAGAEFPANTAIRENDPILILYTSGTTGFPKGALYTHKMLFWNSINTALGLELTTGDRTITCLPLFHTGGWNVFSTPFLHHGAYFCLLQKFDADLILKLLDREEITIFFGVPTILNLMLSSPLFPEAELSKVRYFIVGGEALPLPVIEAWHQKGIPIRQGYGLTEVGPNVTSLHQDDAVRKKGSIGRPNFYIDTRIVDEAGRPVAPGAPGELLLKGPVVTPGYWQNVEETRRAFSGGWFHTGDIVRQDDEGYLFVVDRKKNMYISGGENVYPVEVEKLLYSHPKISEAAVIGVPDAQWGEVGKAFVVPQPGTDISAEEIIAFCEGKIAKYKIPKYIEFLDCLPRGDTGKIERKKLNGLPPATEKPPSDR